MLNGTVFGRGVEQTMMHNDFCWTRGKTIQKRQV